MSDIQKPELTVNSDGDFVLNIPSAGKILVMKPEEAILLYDALAEKLDPKDQPVQE